MPTKAPAAIPESADVSNAPGPEVAIDAEMTPPLIPQLTSPAVAVRTNPTIDMTTIVASSPFRMQPPERGGADPVGMTVGVAFARVP